MNPEQLVAVIGAVTALVVALAALFRQVGELRREVDGRLTQLLELTSVSATARGNLAGRAELAAESPIITPAPPTSGPAF